MYDITWKQASCKLGDRLQAFKKINRQYQWAFIPSMKSFLKSFQSKYKRKQILLIKLVHIWKETATLVKLFILKHLIKEVKNNDLRNKLGIDFDKFCEAKRDEIIHNLFVFLISTKQLWAEKYFLPKLVFRFSLPHESFVSQTARKEVKIKVFRSPKGKLWSEKFFFRCLFLWAKIFHG